MICFACRMWAKLSVARLRFPHPVSWRSLFVVLGRKWLITAGSGWLAMPLVVSGCKRMNSLRSTLPGGLKMAVAGGHLNGHPTVATWRCFQPGEALWACGYMIGTKGPGGRPGERRV